MDIAALSMVMSQSQLQQNVGVSLLKNAMDTGEQRGNMTAELLKTMPNTSAPNSPHMGNSIDVHV